MSAPILTVVLLGLLVAPWDLPAQSATGTSESAASQALEPVASVEGITEYRLQNGLRVLLFPDPSQPTITVNMTYLVGSRHEGYGETGMAHLLEHLLFQGTPDHPDIDQEFADRGVRANGTTWFDRTNYYETFPASPENLEWALDLEADRMVNSFVSAGDLESEMTVVRNEMEAGENSPSRILRERVLSTAYLWHNYGQSTIGARSDVENVPIERLQTFYRKYYQPDNAVLIVAGRFEPEPTLELIRDRFGLIPRPERTGLMRIWPTYTTEPTQDGPREVTLRRVGDEQILTVHYHGPAGSHSDYAPMEILSRILGDAPSGRLYRALVEPGLAARTSSTTWQLAEAGPFFATAVVRAGEDLDAAWEALAGTLEAVGTDEPVTEEEVERARIERLNAMENLFDDTGALALSLSEWAALGDWRLFFVHRDRIEDVDAAAVNRVAARYLKESNRTVGRFIPTQDPVRAEIPPVPDVDSLVSDYRGRDVVAEVETFDPSPANIDARTEVFTLENGFQVAFLEKDTRGGTVQGRFRLLFGDEESLTGRSTAGSLAAAMLMRGTEDLTRQEVADSLERMRADLSVNGNVNIATGSLRTTGQNLPALIDLLGDVLRRPAFSRSEFQILKEQRLASLEAQRSDPGARAQIALARHMNPRPDGHPEHTPTVDEAVQELTAASVEDARSFYRDFYGPQSGNLVLVGDFDPAEVRSALEEALAGWESPHPFERVATDAQRVPAEEIVIEIPDRPNAFTMAQQNLLIRDRDPDFPALALAGFMLGGSGLNARLPQRIREEEGLSYGVAAGIDAHPLDREGTFFMYAIHAPQNAQPVQDAFYEEVERVLDEGFAPDEVQAAKRGYLESRRLSRADDASLATTLSTRLYFERTMDWDAAFEERIRELTPEEVNAALREHLDPEQISLARAGSFESAVEGDDAGDSGRGTGRGDGNGDGGGNGSGGGSGGAGGN